MLLPSNGNGITATVLLVFLSSLSSAAYLDALKASLCTDVAAAAVTLTVAATVTVTVSVDADPTTTTVTNVETTTLTTAAAGAVAAPSISTAPAGCLTNSQAKTIVASFETILSATDRAVALLAAQSLIADEFVETSDSMNSLTGSLLGNYTFASKSALTATILTTAAIPELTTLDIIHDCGRVAWHWAATGIGSGAQEVRGVYLLYTTPDRKQVNMALLEFNSLAWAKDDGWRITRPDGKAY